MSKKTKTSPSVSEPIAVAEVLSEVVAEASSTIKTKNIGESKKLHVEIARGNWKRLKDYIDDHNSSPDRIKPNIGLAHPINEALVQLLNVKEGK